MNFSMLLPYITPHRHKLLAIVALVSLYPAWYAARLEPVEALHSL